MRALEEATHLTGPPPPPHLVDWEEEVRDEKTLWQAESNPSTHSLDLVCFEYTIRVGAKMGPKMRQSMKQRLIEHGDVSFSAKKHAIIAEEVDCLLAVRFIWEARYLEWLSNVMSLKKPNASAISFAWPPFALLYGLSEGPTRPSATAGRPTFADIIVESQKPLPEVVIPMRRRGFKDGEMFFHFSPEELELSASPFRFAVVLKFFQKHPSLDRIRKFIKLRWGLTVQPVMGRMRKLACVMVHLTNEEDFCTAMAREYFDIEGDLGLSWIMVETDSLMIVPWIQRGECSFWYLWDFLEEVLNLL
ncbi:hypothetical protein F2P56_015183 [Juglans regia]|uniref:DUF4283 domain-containing protein n=1 Tax=Juglans regia TaxID=51240 RepID=A0A833XEH0_JUGRE|nr:hypothetical protein F2P56_015183 [Juglans regia]